MLIKMFSSKYFRIENVRVSSSHDSCQHTSVYWTRSPFTSCTNRLQKRSTDNTEKSLFTCFLSEVFFLFIAECGAQTTVFKTSSSVFVFVFV